MSDIGPIDSELHAFMGVDNINTQVSPAAWHEHRTELLKVLTNPAATICGKSLPEAISIHISDAWPSAVPDNTERIAEWKISGTDIVVQTPRPQKEDGKLRFRAGEIARFLATNPQITLDNLAETILATPGRWAGFCFSVAKNVPVYDAFVRWFKRLTKDHQNILLCAPAEIQALCMHIVWISVNCGGMHTLEAVSFDPVVSAVGIHHEFPSLDVISSIIDIIATTGSAVKLADISSYASGYVAVFHAALPATAPYTGLDSVKFVEFAKLACAN